ncbi:amidotransferase [Stutzerimonas stutzeri]|uniref:Amidotransferase n=1 Tax=Stutzerimonas stutzeri TaxID=316 RepID=W8QXJ3_STUST|nr:amidase [Stutzerimonas stutzeri]AHL75345.1 amidotransferase [Stutzerimonas stutzeri]MCQ4328102.1 amidase [Stutzerimonas stutzeri]
MSRLAGAVELAARVRCGETRAEAIAERQLARIAGLNPSLNALVQVDENDVRRQAALIDTRCAAGENLPLAGVPVTIKDNLWLEGQISTCGSWLYRNHRAQRDSWAVARLRQAGALLVGVSNCSEFACKGVTDNRVYGATCNPWDLTRTPGGSSGGAAAAVAAGLGMLALATDAGGSARRPAAHCGVVGMKPSVSRVADPWGFPVIGRELNVIGQLGRRVADVALMLEVLTGSHPADRFSAPMPTLARRPIERLRIGYSLDLGLGYAVDADVAARIEQTVRRLQSAGLQIEPVVPHWPKALPAASLLAAQHAELAAHFGEAYRADSSCFDPAIAEQIEAGFSVPATQLVALAALRDALVDTTAALFETVDLLLCPTVPVEAWSREVLGPSMIGGRPANPRGHAVFTPLFNQVGVPALSVPCGLGAQGMPLGLQIVGPRFHDDDVLRLGAFVEDILALELAPLCLSQMPDTLEQA